LETGLHTKEEIPSLPADGPMLWSFGEADAFDGEVFEIPTSWLLIFKVVGY
jgi:hypothetical protein